MKKILPLIALFASFSAFAIPQQPINGGTGVSNNNANIISLGGPILTSGAFTLSGAFSTTIIVSANSVVTFPSGTHTLASNDGSNASGTWGINVTGSSATSTTATNANNGATVGTVTNATYFPLFAASSTNSNQPFNLGTGLSFNPSTNNLSTTTFTGALVGNANTVTTNANLTGPITSVGNATAVTAASITNAMLAGSIDLTSKVTNTLPFTNGGLGFATATLGDLFYASATNTSGKLADVATGQVLTSGGVGAAPVYSSTPTLAGLTLTSTNPTTLTITDTTTGSSNVASLNIFRGDIANGNSTTNYGTAGASTWFVGLASTANGFTANAKDFVWRANSGDGGIGNVLFFGQTTADVTLPQGNLIVGLVNKGITIKSAAVSAGTANAAIITNVTLSAGTVTINDSYVTTSTVCSFSVVTPGGTPGTAYGVTVGPGTVKVTSTSALDATVGDLGCLKGN